MLERGANRYFYTADVMGSITGVLNAAGAKVEGNTYQAFGENNSFASATLGQPFGYTGREYDAESDLYYFRARYFDRRWGRFISEDPIRFEGGMNFYAYAGNNPVTYTDPFGFAKDWPYSRTRPCNSIEYSFCVQTCGSKGVQSCRVSQLFRLVRWKEGWSKRQWSDGPLSCSCNEPRTECQQAAQARPEAIVELKRFLYGAGIGLGAGAIIGGIIIAPEATLPALPALIPKLAR